MVEQRTVLSNQAECGAGRLVRKVERQVVTAFNGAIAQLEDEAKALLERSVRLGGGAAELLRSVPGIGEVTATTLVAEMPELGSLTDRQAPAVTVSD